MARGKTIGGEEINGAVEAVAACGSVIAAAAQLGISESAMHRRLRAARSASDAPKVRTGNGFEADLPPEEIDIEELVSRRKTQYARKAAHEEASKLIEVRVKKRGPIGILHLGDPHVDDDGTDLAALERDINVARATDGMFIANVGDTTNNWTGRLARLYAEQSTSAAEAWALAEWMFGLIGDKMIYCIGGNHDAWSGTGDPLKWITRLNGPGSYAPSQVRLNLKFPVGRDVRVNARHDFAGHSQYNPAHGVGKALLHGVRDHIAVCGHKHTSGYTLLKDPATGIVGHGIQVASYKVYDRYAKEHGFRDQHISPCAVTVIDPQAESDASLIHVFWDAAEAAEFLTWKRSRA